MTEYDFTLKYRLADPEVDPEQYLEALQMAGCDDALIGIGKKGRIALDFSRYANSALEAVSSAINSVKLAIPEAKLVEASPDFVGLSDIAEFFGFSRQYMRKLFDLNMVDFPEPVHEGKPTLWHLSDVLSWFETRENTSVDQALLEVSRINMQLNFYKACSKVATSSKDGFNFWAEAPNHTFQMMFDPQHSLVPKSSMPIKAN